METMNKNRNQTIIRTEEMAGGKLIYHLKEAEKDVNFEETGVQGPVFTYGVEIISTLTGKEERISCEDISSNVRAAADFFETMIRNTVLPDSLEEIIKDYVDSEAFDLHV